MRRKEERIQNKQPGREGNRKRVKTVFHVGGYDQLCPVLLTGRTG